MNNEIDALTMEILHAFDGMEPEEIDRVRKEWLAELDCRKSELEGSDKVADYVNAVTDAAINRAKRRMKVA